MRVSVELLRGRIACDRCVMSNERSADPAGVAPAPAPTDALSSAGDCATAEKADATRRAYQADWADFTSWSASSGLGPLPAAAATLAACAAALADSGKKYSTIRRRAAAIAHTLQTGSYSNLAGAVAKANAAKLAALDAAERAKQAARDAAREILRATGDLGPL